MMLSKLATCWGRGRLALAAVLLALGLGLWPARAFAQGVPPGLGSDDEGSPILVVAQHSTAPSPVRSGQSFVLTVTLKNTGTKHADDIYASVGAGTSFVGLNSPVPVGKLDPEMQATFSLQVQAPSGLASGASSLPLSFLYRIGESGAYEVVRTVGIEVSGSGASGQPQVVVEGVEVANPPRAVGDTFELALSLRNVGTRKALGVSAALKLNDSLSPARGSGTTQVGDLTPQQAASLSLSLVLDQPTTTGRVLQTLMLEYADADSRRYTSEETVGVDLGAEGRKRPQLTVAAITAGPARPAPGEPVVLSLQVSNVGAGDARRLLLRLGDEAGLPPFAPLDTSNVRFVPEVRAGASVTLTQTLLVDGTAAGGAYRLTVSLAYEDVAGEAYSDSEIISLLVASRPYLQVGLFEPVAAPLRVGEAFEIPVEVVNIGRQTVNVSTVAVTSDDLALTDASLYLGPLDAGTSGSLVPQATAAKAGPASASVVVRYLDEFNQEQTVTQVLTFEVEPQPAAAQPSGEAQGEQSFLGRVWQAIRGFFGLGG